MESLLPFYKNWHKIDLASPSLQGTSMMHQKNTHAPLWGMSIVFNATGIILTNPYGK